MAIFLSICTDPVLEWILGDGKKFLRLEKNGGTEDFKSEHGPFVGFRIYQERLHKTKDIKQTTSSSNPCSEISNKKHRLPTHVQVPKSGTCRSCRDIRECVQVVGVWKMMVKLI